MSLARLTLLAALAALPAAGLAQTPEPTAQTPGPTLRTDDVARLENIDTSLGTALRQALAGGDPAAVTAATTALSGEPLPADRALQALQGEWTCQMIKIGGNLPIVAYPTFQCRGNPDGSFEKLTGSQRTKGTTAIWNDLPVYVGTAYVDGSTPPAYAELPETIEDPGTISPDIGVIEMTAPDRGRILFPAPYVESLMNVLVLTR